MLDRSAGSAGSKKSYFDDLDNSVPDSREVTLLRTLASRIRELAERPEEEEKRRLWTRHNRLEETPPLVFCDPENGWNEIIRQEDLSCTSGGARKLEWLLRREIFWGEQMCDDRPMEVSFHVPHIQVLEGDYWGFELKKEGGEDGGAYHWDSPLDSYDRLPQVTPPEIRIDREKTDRLTDICRSLFDGILEVENKTLWWWSVGLTDELAFLRGMTTLMLDTYDYPDQLHQLMRKLMDGYLARIDFLEEQGLLTTNNRGTYIASGGYGYSDELPDWGEKAVTPGEMWGFAESQVTGDISPDMFEEFIFPYQKEILGLFGLNSYGCCEPLEKRFETLTQIPNLRRLSVSAWADKHLMAEQLGTDYIYSRKPNPAVLASPVVDTGELRKIIREDMTAGRGCRMEYIMKDNHTIGNNPQNVIDWVRIAKEEAAGI